MKKIGKRENQFVFLIALSLYTKLYLRLAFFGVS